jgi:hypothetical protein
MEDFWQRYEYRCGDLGRVMKELQLTKQQERLERKKKQKQKAASKKNSPSDDVSMGTCGSRNYFSCRNLKKESPKIAIKPAEQIETKATERSSQQAAVALELTETVDTVDEEHHHHDCTHTIDHMEEFKLGLIEQSKGVPTIAEASAIDSAKAMDEESLTDESTKESNLPSIFRNPSGGRPDVKDASISVEKEEEHDDDDDDDAVEESNKAGLCLITIWVATLVVAFTLRTGNPPFSGSQYGNLLCSPIRPGTTLDASSLAGRVEDGTVTFRAPWWAAEPLKEIAFHGLCAGIAVDGKPRPRTLVDADVRTEKRRRGEDVQFISVTIREDGPTRRNKPLVTLKRKQTVGVDVTGSKILVENANRRHGVVEYAAPWALP